LESERAIHKETARGKENGGGGEREREREGGERALLKKDMRNIEVNHQYFATHCNTIHHAATLCNILQPSAAITSIH